MQPRWTNEDEDIYQSLKEFKYAYGTEYKKKYDEYDRRREIYRNYREKLQDAKDREIEKQKELKLTNESKEQAILDRNYLIDLYNPDYGGQLKTVEQIEKILRNVPEKYKYSRSRKIDGKTYYTYVKDLYNKAYNDRLPKIKTKKEIFRQKQPDILFENPFKSKYKNPNSDKVEDYQLKPRIKKFAKPYFSNYPYSYEIDHLQYSDTQVTYLFVINVNTRYLFVRKVNGKSGEETKRVINELMKEVRIDNIRGDSDIGFTKYLNSHLNRMNMVSKNNEELGITTYFSPSDFTNKNRIVDSAMRTLRNALGPNSDKYWSGRYDNEIQKLVEWYNNTPHKGIGLLTPFEMQNDLGLELLYIKSMKEELNEVNKRIKSHGLLSLKPGNIVMVHLNLDKTSSGFEKKRRIFDRLGEFIEYKNGNAIISTRVGIDTKIIEVPLYCIEFVASSWNKLEDNVKRTFNFKL